MAATTTFSTQAEVDEAHKVLHETFATGLTKKLEWRKWQLKQLWWLVEDNHDRILEALRLDLNRHPIEGSFADITAVKNDIIDHIKNLEEWTAAQPIDAGFIATRLLKARLLKQPLGVTFIIGAWNFPFLLLLQPLTAAIAAGCCALIKPSELSTHSEQLLAELVPKYLDQRAIRLVTGGGAETGYMLTKYYNHIFFTGSSKIARIVSAAAAKNLTPIVLELGGQGPAIVTKSADVNFAARRIAQAKFMNAGQICLSVNHVFVDPEVLDLFLERVQYHFSQFLQGEGKEHMCRIVNIRNLERLKGLLDGTSGEIIYGGETDPSTRFFHPTVVKGVKMDDSLLSEELFGPILPVVSATTEEAINIINSMPTPLALYPFAKDQRVVEDILHRTLSGGVTINNVFFHASAPNAPFGGVGESGNGAYHGPHGVDCFSHKRAVVQPPMIMDKLLGWMYAPYSKDNMGKLAVKNSLGFKRGETMEDQKIGGSSTWNYVLGVGAVAVAVGLWGDRSWVNKVLRS